MPQLDTRIIAGYIRRSSEMQAENFSLDAQKRAIADSLSPEERPYLVFYTDDERSARGEQIVKRPDFKKLLDDVQAGRVQKVVVHSFDRWSRNVMVTLQSFRILADHQVAFVSLSEHIDYSTPEGRLQLTILAAFAAYFSDMLAKHTSKGKGERAAQGLHNGDTPFGYRRTGEKQPPAKDPETNPGLRMIGELRLRGIEAEKIADEINAAGYRTGSKRFGQRLFTGDTITAILRNEFYAGYAPGDDRGTTIYKGQRYRGQHEATFTYEEWQQIRAITETMAAKPKRAKRARNTYEFAGYIADIQCGLTLRCQTSGQPTYDYYRDVAKKRRIPCATGGKLFVRTDLVRQQFSELLKEIQLPEHWQEMIKQKMQEAAQKAGINQEAVEREKERLRLKKSRILMEHEEGYITDEDFRAKIAAINLTLKELESPHINGVRLEDVLAAGERLPGIAALWDVATPEERREMVLLLLEPEGLYYDLEQKRIAALRPKPAFFYILKMLPNVEEHKTTKGLLVVKKTLANANHKPVGSAVDNVFRGRDTPTKCATSPTFSPQKRTAPPRPR